MEFFEIKKPIRQVGFNEFIIGENILNPQFKLQEDNLEIKNIGTDIISATDINVSQNLLISGIHFIDYITGSDKYKTSVQENISEARYQLEEAFELDSNGDIVPSNAKYISDPIWILRNDNDLELRSNYWRYNTGPDAFTDEISF
jgi:hypothetical protein